MITVRFPTGVAVQYNSATHLIYKAACWELYTKDGGSWVASIQLTAGAICEVVQPCKVYDGAHNDDLGAATTALREAAKELRAERRKLRKKA